MTKQWKRTWLCGFAASAITLAACSGNKTIAPKSAEMDHSTMTGMDHSTMTGMDHSTMHGADHSGMDHSTMPGMHHDAAPLPIAIVTTAPRSNAEMAQIEPGATLQPDAFDAPSPISSAEAEKAAGGGAHAGHSMGGKKEQ